MSLGHAWKQLCSLWSCPKFCKTISNDNRSKLMIHLITPAIPLSEFSSLSIVVVCVNFWVLSLNLFFHWKSLESSSVVSEGWCHKQREIKLKHIYWQWSSSVVVVLQQASLAWFDKQITDIYRMSLLWIWGVSRICAQYSTTSVNDLGWTPTFISQILCGRITNKLHRCTAFPSGVMTNDRHSSRSAQQISKFSACRFLPNERKG